MNYETVIGLEVHAQLLTRSKMYCGCSTDYASAPPNTHVCPVCLGMPGTLPVLNRKAVEFTIRAGLATHCAIAEKSVWARKNYFYPDLPKNYQISQYELPLCTGGYLDIAVEGQTRRIGITRIHMEEDAGKLIHDPAQPISYVDLNRTGTPLMEIVSEPDLRTPEEAAAYLKTLRDILVYLEICDGNMEEGSFRCDANISLRPVGQAEFGTRAELKNMNSFRNVQKALQYEIDRQNEALASGEVVVQETRLFDPSTGATSSMRSKEQAHDYRYFPDPDLLPLKVSAEFVEQVRRELPELPMQKRNRFVEQYQLPRYDADVLTSSRSLADFFEKTTALYPQAKTVSNWVMTELLRLMKAANEDNPSRRVSPEMLAELLQLMDNGVVSGKMAKTIFEEMYDTGRDASSIVKEKGLVQVSDEDELRSLVRKALAENPKEVAKYLSGKTQLLGHFVGLVMKATRGKANPAIVNKLLLEELGKKA
jgi:aspartyl-tRNA(Asn)/glutamyl-tRNA(Gln) amidotransferase subunit B